MAFISVKSEVCEAYIPLENRVTFLRGDSGAGKTSITETVATRIAGDDSIEVMVPKGYHYTILAGEVAIWSLRILYNTIAILDDQLFSETRKFKDVINCLEHNSNYILVINRALLPYNIYNCGFLLLNRDMDNPKKLIAVQTCDYEIGGAMC